MFAHLKPGLLGMEQVPLNCVFLSIVEVEKPDFQISVFRVLKDFVP